MELTMQERKKLTMVKAQAYLKARKTKKSAMLDDFCESTGYCRRHAARSGAAPGGELVPSQAEAPVGVRTGSHITFPPYNIELDSYLIGWLLPRIGIFQPRRIRF